MYGIEINPGDQQYLPLLHDALEGPVQAMLAGSFLVEHIPILQYVPAWVPGAGFQKKFAVWRSAITELGEAPFAQAKAAIVRAVATGCEPVDSLLHMSVGNRTRGKG